MSAFETEFAAAADADLFSKFGVAGTYTPAAPPSTPVSISEALWEPDELMPAYGPRGHSVARTATLMIKVSDVAAPVMNDTWTYGGQDWTVVSVQAASPTTWELAVKGSDPTERSHDGYRLPG